MPKVQFELQGAPETLLSFSCPIPVTLENIKENFPLPGNWHFRAKVNNPTFSFIWEDLTEEEEEVPRFMERYYLKVFPIDIPDYEYEESEDLITDVGVERKDIERKAYSDPAISFAPSAMSSVFGRAMKGAMDTVRKNVG